LRGENSSARTFFTITASATPSCKPSRAPMDPCRSRRRRRRTDACVAETRSAAYVHRGRCPSRRRLASRTTPRTRVVQADFLKYPLTRAPHVIAGNLPFQLTTAMLRRLLHGPGWTDAVLLVQWEVTRRRAAVGGATMMTAQWWPWFEFGLVQWVSAPSFTPQPSVDGGLMTISRRADSRTAAWSLPMPGVSFSRHPGWAPSCQARSDIVALASFVAIYAGN
jgi:Ribosomal RNA adenine dimethylase